MRRESSCDVQPGCTKSMRRESSCDVQINCIMISVSYRSLLGRCKIIASVKRLKCTARLHKIDASRKQLRCTDRLQHCVATAIVTQRRGIKTTFSNSSPKTLACETFVYKTLTVFNSSRKRLRLNSGWNADAQACLRLNSCRKTQLLNSGCDADA